MLNNTSKFLKNKIRDNLGIRFKNDLKKKGTVYDFIFFNKIDVQSLVLVVFVFMLFLFAVFSIAISPNPNVFV